MTNTVNQTRNIFDASKNYFGGLIAGGDGVFVHDWDLNENIYELSWWLLSSMNALAGVSGRIEKTSGKSFQPSERSVPDDDITFTDGEALVRGRLVQLDAGGSFDYEDHTYNYITKGAISTLTEIIATTKYKFTDIEKLWNSNYSLADCELVFTSGALSGSAFSIDSLTGGQIVVSGDLSTATVGDTYVIRPPRVSTASGTTTTVYLVTWFEDISAPEDAILSGGTAAITDPLSGLTPSHRRQLRWCLHLGWSGSSGTSPIDGHIATPICTVDLTANTTVVDADITDSGTYLLAADKGQVNSDTLSTATSDITTAQTDITALENKVSRMDAIGWDYYPFGYWSFTNVSSSEDIGIGDAEFVTANLKNKVTDPYYISAAADTLVNAETDSSFLYIDIAAGLDGVEGSLASNVLSQQDASASTQILEREIAVAAIRATTGTPPVIERLLPMGKPQYKNGLDFTIYRTSSSPNVSPCRISPGEITIDGELYQNPSEYLIADCNVVGAHRVGGVPSDTFTYLYAFTQSGRRDLTFQFDPTRPLWNGRHRTEKAHCIGYAFFSAGLDVAECICRNNKVFFALPSSSSILAFGGGAGSSVALTVQPPKGISEFSVRVDIDQTAIDETVSVFITGDDTTYPISVQRKAVIEGNGTISETSHVLVLPGGMSSYSTSASDHDSTSPNINIWYETLTFNPFYFPDQTTWEG